MKEEKFTSRLISSKELSRYLGLSVRIVYRLVKHGQIPSLRVGRVYRFDLEDIDRWIEETKAAQRKGER